jgi:hypothetical protein
MLPQARTIVSNGRTIDATATVLALPLAAAFGWAMVNRQTFAMLPAAALAGLPFLLSARFRFLFVIFGTIFVFGGSDELTTQKLLYLFGLVGAAAGALLQLDRHLTTPAARAVRPFLFASVVFAGLIVISGPVSVVLNDTPPRDWMRDVTPYAFIVTVPLFALDGYRAFGRRTLDLLIAAAGLLGALSFAVVWLNQRGIAKLPLEFLGFPTVLLGGALFAYGISAVLQRRRIQIRWLVLPAVVFALLVATGTRSSFVLAAAPLAVVFGSTKRFARRSARLAVAVPILALTIFFGTQSVLRGLNANEDVFRQRLALFSQSASETDRSYQVRVASTKAAWRDFTASPLFGQGPGTPIEWVDYFGRTHAEAYVDSPVGYLAKFGLGGVVALLALVGAFFAVLRQISRANGGPTVASLALLGYGGIVAAYAVLQVALEDKGFAVGLILLMAIALRDTFGDADVAPFTPRPDSPSA